MNFLELVNKRQSQRSYKDTPVEREKILKCIEAARLAPSACNSQPWRFVVVDNSELKTKIAATASAKILGMNQFANQAPVIVALVDEGSNLTAKLGGKIKDKEYNKLDIGIAAEHFCLQATEEELGTCMIGWFDEKNAKKLLNIPAKKRIELLITVGYPANDKIRTKMRKQISEIHSFNSYTV